MSTNRVSRKGGVDRTGLENLLGSNGHPMNGLAYGQGLLGGNLMGVLPLTEGRYACFFREYHYVDNTDLLQDANRVLVVSTVSGNSRVIDLGNEDWTWKGFDSTGNLGYLLCEKDGNTQVHVLRGDNDTVRVLSTFDAPTAQTQSGTEFQFGTNISVTSSSIYILHSDPEEGLFFARQPMTGIKPWAFSSEGIFRNDGADLSPQTDAGGIFIAQGVPSLVDVRGPLHLFDHAGGKAKIFKLNRYGSWEEHGEVSPPDTTKEVVGFCLVKGAPAYSAQESRYTIPAVFTLSGEPYTQAWVKATID